MTSKNSQLALQEELAKLTGTNPQDWYLTFKARLGMEVVFRQLYGEFGSGSVATQLFTCATAINPILVSGLVPEYFEVSASSLAVDPALVELPQGTRAVVIQHTFGIVDQERGQALAQKAQVAGALVVEDSAHCVGQMLRDGNGQPLADISIHSFGAEKLLPTKFGGAIWLNPNVKIQKTETAIAPENGCSDGLRQRMVDAFQGLPTPNRKQAFAASSYRNQLRVLTRLPQKISYALRRVLERVGVFDPPISAKETQGSHAYPPVAMSSWVAQQAQVHLRSIVTLKQQRSQAVGIYLSELSGHVQIPSSIRPEMSLVRFPIFVSHEQDAEELFSFLESNGVRGGRWYRPALFPGVPDPEVYGYSPGAERHRTTEGLIQRVVNLPTNVSEDLALAAALTVKKWLNGRKG